MILEMDAGNSRLKWRVIENSHSQTELIAKGISEVQGSALDILLQEIKSYPITRIRLASVCEESVNLNLKAKLQSVLGVLAEIAATEHKTAGVTNSYSDVGAMGVDRWLAMIAAYSKAGGACCVLDCGSAITLDLVNKEGLHLGGYIVPGLRLMQDSLAAKSAALCKQLSEQKGLFSSLEPGQSTVQAINHGILAMVTAFAQNIQDKNESDQEAITWYLCGGDAETVGQHISWSFEIIPDLVLDGLALALP